MGVECLYKKKEPWNNPINMIYYKLKKTPILSLRSVLTISLALCQSEFGDLQKAMIPASSETLVRIIMSSVKQPYNFTSTVKL